MGKTDPMMARARAGLEAWLRGDVDALVPLLDPDVELLWWEPGDWDCHGKDEVIELLRERASQEAPAEVDIVDVEDDTLLVERRETATDGPQAGYRPVTSVEFRGGRVVRMRQYLSRDEAIARPTG